MNVTPPAPDRLPASPLVVANVTRPQRLQLRHMPDGSHPGVSHSLSALCDVVQGVVGEVSGSIAVCCCGHGGVEVLHTQKGILRCHISPAARSGLVSDGELSLESQAESKE